MFTVFSIGSVDLQGPNLYTKSHFGEPGIFATFHHSPRRASLLRLLPFLSKTDRKQPSTLRLPAVSRRATGKKDRKKLKSRPKLLFMAKIPGKKNDINCKTLLIMALETEKFKGKNCLAIDHRPFTI
jgi:hypothetical protein